MGKTGPKPKKIISEKWSANLAYAVGLLATDGCISRYGHLIDLTSKDKEQLLNYCQCLNINKKIGEKSNGHGQTAFRIQFRNVIFYEFLMKIGITPAKSNTLGPLKIPRKYFFDFLRGSFDGDGCSYSYWDKRWKSSFMFYISFASGSIKFIEWLQSQVQRHSNLHGHISVHQKKEGRNNYYQLRYSKYEAIKIAKLLFKDKRAIKLTRKYLKINESLDIVRRHKGRVFVK